MQKKQLAMLLAVHLLWGLVLWFSVSKYGMGLSTDSVHLLFAGRNLADGRGLISFDGSPVVAWPPLYPVLLGALHLVTGLSTFAAAHLLQVAAFLVLALCTSILFLKMFEQRFGFALAACILSDIGAVAVLGFDLVGSDYVHLALVMACTLLTAYYIERPSGGVYAGIFAAGMLAMLQRYVGVAAIITAATAIVLFTQASLKQRLLRGLWLALAALPAGLWLVLTSPRVERRAPVSFLDNLDTFSRAVLEWLLPVQTVESHPLLLSALLWLVLVTLVVLAVNAWRHGRLPRSAVPLLLFGAVYTVVLFGSAAITYYNKLEGRFLLPLYIPFVALLVWAAYDAFGRGRSEHRGGRATPAIAFGVLSFAGLLLLSISLPAVAASHSGTSGNGENSFNTVEWRTNKALDYWRRHTPEYGYLLLSNQPDGLAFYTRQSVSSAPRRTAGPYAKEELPVESYAGELFGAGQDVYLVWIEPEEREYFYRPKDLEAIADVKELYSGQDGSVYRLRPLPGG